MGALFCLNILSYADFWFIAGKHHSTSFSGLRNSVCDFGIDWFGLAGLDFSQSQKGLSMADSNSRVQAVIDGQGIALWDQLVTPEVNSGHLQYLSDIWLDEYGYYLHAKESNFESKTVGLFLTWLRDESMDAD